VSLRACKTWNQAPGPNTQCELKFIAASAETPLSPNSQDEGRVFLPIRSTLWPRTLLRRTPPRGRSHVLGCASSSPSTCPLQFPYLCANWHAYIYVEVVPHGNPISLAARSTFSR
jgi:hypothetical protein